MDHPVSYHQNCPVCGRTLQIGVMLLGRRVYCQHCGGGFIATDATGSRPQASPGAPTSPRLDAVDALIEKAELVLGRSACGGGDAVD